MIQERKRWTINKEISIGDLIAFSVAAAAVITAYFTLDKRVSVLESSTAEAAKSTEMWRNELREEIKDINHKLDKALEK
jgi:hypothetical protein